MPQAATRENATQCGNMFCNEPPETTKIICEDNQQL